MKRIGFYPGCALQSMSWDYRESLWKVAAALEIDLVELPDWTCCGATAANSLDEQLALDLPLHNLIAAQKLGLELAVACPMCLKRSKAAQLHCIKQHRSAESAAIEGLAIYDLARLLASEPFLAKVRDRIRRPLSKLRTVCYYGCQVVRPPKITGYEDYENPLHLDRLVEVSGATAVDWSMKATCCGAGIGIPRRDIGRALVARLIDWARLAGADAIIVCCPLCQNNLDMKQFELMNQCGREPPIPVLYYTEWLGVAFDLRGIDRCLRSHLIDPMPLFERKVA